MLPAIFTLLDNAEFGLTKKKALADFIGQGFQRST
jgi:hypothetical protein